MSTIEVPALSLILLVGPSGSGKSSFARKHFRPTEVLSSDACRALVSDDENDQSATADAFAVLQFVAQTRLHAGRLTVIDATNVQPEARRPLLALAREHDCLAVAIVFDVPERLCQERNRQRPDRSFGPHVVRQQVQQLRRSLRSFKREGLRHVHVLRTAEEVNAAAIVRVPLWTDRRSECGPFDIVGDVHGCREELERLLVSELGYAPGEDDALRHPQGRKVVFVGDLVDRGPDTPGVLRLVMGMTAAGTALCVPGNHDMKLLRKLRGREVRVTHGLAESLEQLAREPPEFLAQVIEFLDGLISHYVLDEGRLVVAHAGLKRELQGRASARVRDFALYGETTGETDEFGLPVRHDWAAEYRGEAHVVYGHTPVLEPRWQNRTINVDTGCVFGGRLTALRWPERELRSVAAAGVHYMPARPLRPGPAADPGSGGTTEPGSVAGRPAALLDIQDVTGKRIVTTRLRRSVTLREENSAAALEVMSRFAVDPGWLVYLPPTMAPPRTSSEPGLLEHPAEAFEDYAAQGVTTLVCQEKHMGSRCVLVVCRADAAARCFGAAPGAIGRCFTRTGRPFFDEAALERELLGRVQAAVERAGLWDELATDWLMLDAELMPWSAKAQELLRVQYAPVGAAARVATGVSVAALEAAIARGLAGAGEHVERARRRAADADAFTAAYRRYCWPVRGLQDLRLAPFHLLASAGATHFTHTHLWHLETLSRLGAADAAEHPHAPLLAPTRHRVVELQRPDSRAEAVAWWQELTAQGAEGMVVKPLEFAAWGRRGLVQPAIKCRGREYLRLIYGPEYDAPANLERLRQRGLARKRSLALREFALGVEALERFVAGEPLYRVHECVFGVLALESEPVDPRL